MVVEGAEAAVRAEGGRASEDARVGVSAVAVLGAAAWEGERECALVAPRNEGEREGVRVEGERLWCLCAKDSWESASERPRACGRSCDSGIQEKLRAWREGVVGWCQGEGELAWEGTRLKPPVWAEEIGS